MQCYNANGTVNNSHEVISLRMTEVTLAQIELGIAKAAFVLGWHSGALSWLKRLLWRKAYLAESNELAQLEREVAAMNVDGMGECDD